MHKYLRHAKLKSHMERTTLDQATDLIAGEQEILLVTPEKSPIDAFCAMVALGLALEKYGKKVKMVCASHVPQNLQFLPGTSQVQEFIERTSELVVNVPLSGARPANVAWEQNDGILRFIITPERGRVFSDPAVTMENGRYPWHLIVTVGAPDLSSLGSVFSGNANFFYETPVLNIDRGTANEFFGAVNLVSATAGTVCEITYELLEALGGVNLLTNEVATNLFAGILSGTRSFQSPTTTPRTFAIAAELLRQEADRQTVTRNLFKTRKLPELRLLGRSLARLKEVSQNVLWSLLLQKDFEDSGASPDDVISVIQEIVERSGERTQVIMVFERNKGTVETLIYPGRLSDDDKTELAGKLNGTVTGSYVLATLGNVQPSEVENNLKEIILPKIPKDIG